MARTLPDYCLVQTPPSADDKFRAYQEMWKTSPGRAAFLTVGYTVMWLCILLVVILFPPSLIVFFLMRRPR